ncbi:MAG: LCP family protein [Ruminiclostridium sp.]|nr:LCP family protein [Ruminiclostridium sp.]
MTKRRSNWYIYLITFLIAGVIVYIASNALLNSFYESQKREENVSQNTGTVFKPDKAHNFTVLAMLADEAGSVPDYYMTVTYRGDTNSIILMPYLKNSCMNGNTLANAYRNGGAEAATKLVADATGVKISKYVKFSKSTLIEFFDMAGNTTLTVPTQLKHENKDDKTMTIINKGTSSFTGRQLYAYVTFPDYGVKDDTYPCKIQGGSYSEFINQNFNGLSEGSIEQYSQFIINFTETNITKQDYEQKKKALLYSFSYTNEICDYYVPYGEMTSKGYEISADSLATVKSKITETE